MSQIIGGHTFVPLEKNIDDVKLNAITGGATITSELISTQTLTTSAVTGDQFLILKAGGTLARLLYENFTPSIPNAPLVLGGTAADPTVANGIVVPRYAAHPDRIWTYGTFDDHFDTPASGTPNAKWVRSISNPSGTGVNVVYTQGGSKLCLAVGDGTGVTSSRQNWVTQQLPVQTTHQISLRLSHWGFTTNSGTNNWAGCFLNLEYAASSGAQIFYQVQQLSGNLISQLQIRCGASLATTIINGPTSFIPPYFRMTYDSGKNTNIEASFDGVTWMAINATGPLTPAQTGFGTTAPVQWSMGVFASYYGFSLMQVDWIKHV